MATTVSAKRAAPGATKRVRKPFVYGHDRSAGYLLRMAPEELEALKAAAAEQESTLRDFVLVAALRAAGWPVAADCQAPEPPSAEQEQFVEQLGQLLVRMPADMAAELKLLLFGTTAVRVGRETETVT